MSICELESRSVTADCGETWHHWRKAAGWSAAKAFLAIVHALRIRSLESRQLHKPQQRHAKARAR